MAPPGRRPAAPAGRSRRGETKNKESDDDQGARISPDKYSQNVPVFDGTNFPIWQRKIKMHLQAQKLLSLIEEPLPENASSKQLDCANQASNVLSNAVTNEVFLNTMNDETDNDPIYAIWNAIKSVYASDSILSIFQVWNKWRKINFNLDMNKFISQIEESLGKFSAIGLKVPDQLISCDIIGRITEKRTILKEALFSDLNAVAKPRSLITKLREIGRHEITTGKSITGDSSSGTTALATLSDQSKKSSSKVLCKYGRHNPAATTHTIKNCWTLKPELKEKFDQEKAERASKRPRSAYHTKINRDDQVSNDASSRPSSSFSYHTDANQSEIQTTILDSGASNHMLNSLKFFKDTVPVQIGITTGSGPGELVAVARGNAVIPLGNGQTIELKEALFVPNLSRNLISFIQLMQEKAVIYHCNGSFEVKLDSN
jgi:hypothetical protein